MVDGGRTTTDGRRMDDGLWLYYKLTNGPKGSGELKKKEEFEFTFGVFSTLKRSECFLLD